MFKLVLGKTEEPEIKVPTSAGSSKKQESSRKASTSALLTMPKTLNVWITTNCGKFLQRWEYQTTWSVSWEVCTQIKKQQLEPDKEQWTGSKLKKEYVKAVYRHPAIWTYIHSTSCKIPGWINHKLESRLLEEISITSDMQMTPPLWQKGNRNWRTYDESERGEWKSWFKTQHSENEDHGIWSHHFMANRWGSNGNSERLYFLGLQNHCRW